MKKLFLFIAIHLNLLLVKADEGMWLPFLLNPETYEQMRALGLKLTPEDIYSINRGSLKDAIVVFGTGCTGHVVSSQGLIFTNHHCGYPAIAALSSVSNDILTNGFYAQTYEEELYPNTNLKVKFLLRVEDVTRKIIDSIPFEATEKERKEIVQRIARRLEKEATINEFYEATVREFYYGNEYYLFVYEVYPDVRLVLTPPLSIGNFGGDTDNWMWPRHTGDFSVFRVYASPDGKPAHFSKSNVPLKPKHFLPISIASRKEGDFTMILGYPGSTKRYITSYEIKMLYHVINPLVIDIRAIKLKILKESMEESQKVRLKYVANYQYLSNYYKYYKGQNQSIMQQNLINQRISQEEDFESWADNDEILKSDYYKSALIKVYNSISKMAELQKTQRLIYECFTTGNSFFRYIPDFFELDNILSSEKVNLTDLNQITQKLMQSLTTYFHLFDFDTEKKLLAAMLQAYAQHCPPFYSLNVFKEIKNKFNGNYYLFANAAFSSSIFGDSLKMNHFLKNPTRTVLVNDPLYILGKEIQQINKSVSESLTPLQDQLNQGMRLYVKGLREKQQNKNFYPDGNKTMRISFGTIKGYKPKDAVEYMYYTTIDGLLMKEDPTSEEFKVPELLKKLYEKRDFGRYGENGTLVVCFITNNDITGGNSGSPVLNGNGELIGLAFDKNWEATTSDFRYLPDYQRSIVVDIRYVLFVMDKMMNAQRIINEMDIRS
ncbi:MAG: S46 family peptidase [Bacteroidales bacterium]|nr:S46 family peptidase [Bacteroidales bacterium]